jgi:hypothetical protein
MKPRVPYGPYEIVPKHTTYYPHIAAIVVLWAGVMTMTYHDQAAVERERTAEQAARADRIDQKFTACLKGTYRAKTEEGGEIACWPAEIVLPHEKRKES